MKRKNYQSKIELDKLDPNSIFSYNLRPKTISLLKRMRIASLDDLCARPTEDFFRYKGFKILRLVEVYEKVLRPLGKDFSDKLGEFYYSITTKVLLKKYFEGDGK